MMSYCCCHKQDLDGGTTALGLPAAWDVGTAPVVLADPEVEELVAEAVAESSAAGRCIVSLGDHCSTDCCDAAASVDHPAALVGVSVCNKTRTSGGAEDVTCEGDPPGRKTRTSEVVPKRLGTWHSFFSVGLLRPSESRAMGSDAPTVSRSSAHCMWESFNMADLFEKSVGSRRSRELGASNQQGRPVLTRTRTPRWSLTDIGRVGVRNMLKTAALVNSALRDSMDVDLTDNLAHEVFRIATFGGQEHLLRGTRLFSVMRGCGKLFASSKGTERTYAMSENTICLDAFLSHNWSVPRWKKFVALAYIFNLSAACGVALLLALAIGVTTGLDLLPVFEDKIRLVSNQTGGSLKRCGYFGRALGTPVFLLVFFFACDIGRWFRLGPIVFLDKACIHQTDATIMQQGIKKLGAFIAMSKRMVVLYSDAYLVRLWTVYEVASFITLHNVRNMHVVPVRQAIVFGVVICCAWLYQIIIMLLSLYTGPGKVIYGVVSLMFMCFYVRGLRDWFRDRLEISRRLTNFSLRNCDCAVESDREIVHSNIILLMRATGKVTASTGDEETLAAFDELVKEMLPHAFSSALGSGMFSYRHYLVIGMTASLWTTMDQMAFARDLPRRQLLAHLLKGLFWILFAWPAVLLLMEAVSSCCLSVRGGREIVLVVLYSMLLMPPIYACGVAMVYWEATAAFSDVALWLLIIVLALGPFIVRHLGVRKCRCRHRWSQRSRQRAELKEESIGSLSQSSGCLPEDASGSEPGVADDDAPSSIEPISHEPISLV